MGIMVTKDNQERDELTRRINADLREKMNKTSKVTDDKKDPDFVEDSDYTRDLKKTGKYGWVFIFLIMAILLGLIIFGISFAKK